MSVTKILARNLPEAARGRIGGLTEVYLDTPEGFGVRLSKDVERLSNLNKITIEGALRTALDFTDTNNAVLVEFLTPLTVDKRSKWIDVTVFIDGVPAQFSRMYVISKNSDSGQWEVEFALPEDHWMEQASAKKINTIDFGGYRLTNANVLDSWNYPAYDGDYTPTQDGNGWNPAYGWWPADTGNWVDQEEPGQNTIKPVKMMAVEDLRPHVNLMYLLKRGFCEIGWTLGGLMQEHEWARSLWAYLLRDEYYTGKGYDGIAYGKYCRIIGRIVAMDVGFAETPTQQNIYFTALDYVGAPGFELPFQGDPNKWACGIKNPLPFTAKFKFSFKFELEAASLVVVPQTFLFNIQELDPDDTDNDTFTGEILSDDASFDIDVGETKFLAFDFDVTLKPGQKAALHWGGLPGSFAGIIKRGMWFRCEPNNEAFTRNDEVDLRTALDIDISLLDVLKAWAHLINGRFETDYNAKTVNIYPERTNQVYDTQVTGFIREDLPVEDISHLIMPNSVKLRFIRPELKRYTRLSFADSSDSYIEDLVLTEPLHSRKINNGNDLPDEVDEIQNPLFEPTAERQSELLKQQEYGSNRPNSPTPWLPVYWDNTDQQRSFSIGPRILFAFGLYRQKNPSYVAPTDKYSAFYFDQYTTPTEAFGYATQLKTWELFPTPPLDGSVVFGRAAADLFVNHYIGLTLDNRGGIEVDLLQQMSMAQYSRYNFRQLFSFAYEGRKMRLPMTSIRDFVPGLPTPVTYFATPVETECCDLPCSCRFRTCDYYQDLGVYLLQSTMDDLNVSSFKIDGMEILTAPVPLGQLNIIELAGGAYVTNLVDALNSIGAPYFTFGYSTRQHASKGLRFFTIKYPACQGFEIIVSDVSDPVYRYTQDEQQEQWFAGTWGAIGYGAETYTEPDNCSTTVEY